MCYFHFFVCFHLKCECPLSNELNGSFDEYPFIETTYFLFVLLSLVVVVNNPFEIVLLVPSLCWSETMRTNRGMCFEFRPNLISQSQKLLIINSIDDSILENNYNLTFDLDRTALCWTTFIPCIAFDWNWNSEWKYDNGKSYLSGTEMRGGGSGGWKDFQTPLHMDQITEF